MSRATDTAAIEATIKTITMERMPIWVNAIVPNLPKGVKTTAYINLMEDVAGGLIAQMGAYVLRSPWKELKWHRYELPTTWWEMLKRDWAPKWFLERYPVRNITHTFRYEQNIHICPHADIEWPKDEHLIFMKVMDYRPDEYRA